MIRWVFLEVSALPHRNCIKIPNEHGACTRTQDALLIRIFKSTKNKARTVILGATASFFFFNVQNQDLSRYFHRWCPKGAHGV